MPTIAHASDPALMHTDGWLEGCPGNLYLEKKGRKDHSKKAFLSLPIFSSRNTIEVKKIQGEEKIGLQGGSRGQSLQEGPKVGSWSRTQDSTFEPCPTLSGSHSPSLDWNLSEQSQLGKGEKDKRPLTVQS